jgi:hypothetical protein
MSEGEVEYEFHENGVIHQSTYKKVEYNYDYSNKYNNYGEKGNYLGYLRLGTLIGAVGHVPRSILDVGYGNGSFLAAAATLIPDCAGCDISPYPVPSGCRRVESIDSEDFDVVCFFDSLEHFDDIGVVNRLKCKYVYISVPWCPTKDFTSAEFLGWYHRRPNEHLWHFDDDSLKTFFDGCGFDCVMSAAVEDAVRKNAAVAPRPNILTALFKKR